MKAADNLSFIILNLRAVVAAFGEISSPVWWNTSFMNAPGFRYLERLYPRSFFNAALHAAGRAACDVHDRGVGRIGAYHLFRLSEGLEEDVRVAAGAAQQAFIEEFRSSLGNVPALMDRLKILCDGRTLEGVLPGPRRIGDQKDLRREDAFREAAVVYFHAFKTGKPAFPYFAVAQKSTPHRL